MEFVLSRAGVRNLRGGKFSIAALGAAPLVGVVFLTAIAVAMSFQGAGEKGDYLTLEHYRALYGDSFALRAFSNTLVFAVTATGVALVFAIPIAWLVERTRLPGKNLVFPLMSIGLLTPGFFTAMGWVFLLHPRIGVVNRWLMDGFGLEKAPFNVATVVGMGFVQGLSLVTIAFVMIAASFRNLDAGLEEAAQIHGLGFFSRLRRIVFPLLFPGILAASIYVFTIALSSFEVPAIIGLGNKIFTFSTFVYFAINPVEGLPNYGVAGATCSLMIVIAVFLSWWYFRILNRSHRYAVVSGKNYQPRLSPLSPLASFFAWLFLGAFFLLGKILPLVLLVWAALMPYFQPPSGAALEQASLVNFKNIPWDMFLSSLWNTGILIFLVPSLMIFLGLAISWVVVRSGSRFAFVYDFLAFLPHPLPNIIFAVSAIYVSLFWLPNYIPLYGTVWLLVVVYAISKTSFTTRVFNTALVQIHKELDEAAQVSGLTTGLVAQKILIPLLKPAMLYAWLWMALATFRELTMASILVTRTNLTLPVAVWGLWESGHPGSAAAASLIVMAIMTPLVLIYWLCGRRQLEITEA